MDAQRGLSVSGHRNTVLCLHLTSDTYHVTPSGRAPRARGKFWIRRVKLRIFRPDPKSHKSEGFPAAQIFKTHKSQNTYCRSAHFSKAVKFVGAQNPRGTTRSWPNNRDAYLQYYSWNLTIVHRLSLRLLSQRGPTVAAVPPRVGLTKVEASLG